MAWDILSGAAKMAWDVLSGVTKTAWDVLSGVANRCGMFCPGCQKMAWDVLSRDVLSCIRSRLLYKCRLLITFENSSNPTKWSCENARMCGLVSALAARDESVIFFFSAYLLIVSSADNLFKQLGHRSDLAKLTSENVCL